MENQSSEKTILSRISGSLNNFCEIVLVSTLCAMTFLTIIQIICRMYFKALTWSEEVTSFLLVFASFSGIVVGVHKGAHIAVTFLVDQLPSTLHKGVVFITNLLAIAFFGVVGWYGAILSWEERTQTAASLNVSMGLIYLVFPVASVVAIVHLLALLESKIRGRS